eukprot:scaffold527317_cov36-Prasinocladus_malaysianus.AAC.1
MLDFWCVLKEKSAEGHQPVVQRLRSIETIACLYQRIEFASTIITTLHKAVHGRQVAPYVMKIGCQITLYRRRGEGHVAPQDRRENGMRHWKPLGV